MSNLAIDGGEKLITEDIPFAGFGADYIDHREEEAVVEALRAGSICRISHVVSKSYAYRLEEKLCDMLSAEYLLAVNSCTSALHCAVVGLDIGPGDEVLTAGVGWVSSASTVLQLGAIPIAVEYTENLRMDSDDLERKITDRTKAIIVVHWRGIASDMDEIMALAQKHNIKVIEDCAQSFSGKYKGRWLGTIGDIGCYSFNAHKVITCGEGGAVVTNDPDVYAKMVGFSGMYAFYRRKYNPDGKHTNMSPTPMLNLRIPEICAAMALVQLGKLEEILKILNDRKDELVAGLKHISGCNLVPLLEGDVGYTVPIAFETRALAERFANAMYAEGANNISNMHHSFGGAEARGTVAMAEEDGLDLLELGEMGIAHTWICVNERIGPSTKLNAWALTDKTYPKPAHVLAETIDRISHVVAFKTNVLMKKSHIDLIVDATRKVYGELYGQSPAPKPRVSNA